MSTATMPQTQQSDASKQEKAEETTKLEKFEVDGIVPIVENGDVLPHFANKPRGKYIKHKELSKEQILELRREQNREAARRMRRKKAQQRKFLEEEISKIQLQLQHVTNIVKINELKSRLQELESSRQEIVAIQNRSSQNKKNKRKVQ